MTTVETSNYCATCGHQTLHHKQRINHLLHLVLSVLTGGIWALFVWLPIGLANSSKRTRCTHCGDKPGWDTLKHDVGEAFGLKPTRQR